MIDPDALLWLHHDELDNRGPGAPQQTILCRAVSSFYYALFHELCRQIADQHIGSSRRKDPQYVLVYRALEHGRAKDVCRRVAADPRSSTEASDVAVAFVSLQEGRHRADYDPISKFSLSDVRGFFLAAEGAIEKLRRGFVDKPIFLTRLLVRERTSFIRST